MFTCNKCISPLDLVFKRNILQINVMLFIKKYSISIIGWVLFSWNNVSSVLIVLLMDTEFS